MKCSKFFFILLMINFAWLNCIIFQTDSKITEIEYFIYYLPEKDILYCSNKSISNKEISIIPNELNFDGKYTCMVALNKKHAFYRLNFHILKIKSKNNKKDLLDIYIGETLTLQNINLLKSTEFIDKYDYLTRQILLKFSDEKIFYIKNTNCNFEFLNDCGFIETSDSIFRKNNLMLNFKLKDSNSRTFSFIEKKSIFFYLII